LAKAQTATKVIGIAQREKDTEQKLTGTVELRWNASVTGMTTAASDVIVHV